MFGLDNSAKRSGLECVEVPEVEEYIEAFKIKQGIAATDCIEVFTDKAF